MSMTDEEATAELERLQQRITRNLQEIDKNFAEGNQVVSSMMIPNIERYAEATSRVWNHCKIWLYFFESLDKTGGLTDNNGITNRPPHNRDDSTIDSADRSSWNRQMSHDVTIQNITDLNTLSRLRMSMQQPASTASPDSTSPSFLRPPHALARPSQTARSVSTTSTTTHSSLQRPTISPPRTMPFGIEPSSLAGTPIREAARILTENVLETAGIRSSDDDSFEFNPDNSSKRPRTERTNTPVVVETGKAWDETNMMEVDDTESRAKAQQFFQQRQSRRIDLDEELPTLFGGRADNSPSNRDTRFEAPLAGTPTTDRVLLDIMAAEGEREQQQEQEQEGAYEFSDAMPHDKFEEYLAKDRQSLSGSDLSFQSGSNMTMMSGSTGQIPAKFDLQYFPQKFRTPPASAQLTRVYNYFAEKPGIMITSEDVSLHLNDIPHDAISLLISLLVRKKFLKKVGNKDAWTVRR